MPAARELVLRAAEIAAEEKHVCVEETFEDACTRGMDSIDVRF